MFKSFSPLIKWLNVVTIAGIIVMNALANILPFNNLTTGELSDRVNVLFTPAGYVFSIWSLIYILLVIWVIRPFFSLKPADTGAYQNAGYLFIINGILNSSWLLLFHYEFYRTTLLVMVALLINLIMIYRKVNEPRHRSVWVVLPFSVYMGWISVATILNIGIFFNASGFENGLLLPAEIWTVVILIVAAGLAIFLMRYLGDRVYPLVYVWAFAGIAVERWHEYPSIAFTAVFAALTVAAATVTFITKKKGFYAIKD